MNSLDLPKDLASDELDSLVDSLAEAMQKEHGDSLQSCMFLGLETGGMRLARLLHSKLALQSELGSINVHFHRDDFSQKGVHPGVGASHIPESVDNRQIILVDDVLYTGRTVRAALNELFDYGRPALIQLAVLIDRDGRELPVQADFSAANWTLGADKTLKLSLEEPLSMHIENVEK